MMEGNVTFIRDYNTDYEFRTADWITPTFSDDVLLIKTVVLPSAIGMQVGIVSDDGLYLFSLPGDEWKIQVDSQELFGCVVAIFQDCDVLFHINGFEVPARDLFGNNHHRNVCREIVHAKQDVGEYLSYTMVQVFHHEIAERGGLDPVKVCFAFYVLTPYSGEPFIVQINTKFGHDCIPINGYQMANVSVLCEQGQGSMAFMEYFLIAMASHSKSLCGPDPFVIVPLENVRNSRTASQYLPIPPCPRPKAEVIDRNVRCS
jgi:hypothetical protein